MLCVCSFVRWIGCSCLADFLTQLLHILLYIAAHLIYYFLASPSLRLLWPIGYDDLLVRFDLLEKAVEIVALLLLPS